MNEKYYFYYLNFSKRNLKLYRLNMEFMVLEKKRLLNKIYKLKFIITLE